MKPGLFPPDRRSFLFRLAGTLLTIGLLVYLMAQQGWSGIYSAFLKISAWRLVLAFLLIVASRLAVTARWHVLLRSAGVSLSIYQSARLTFSGLFAANFLPTTIGGDVFRLAGGIQLRLEPATCAASLVVDRLVGMVGMAMALPLGWFGWLAFPGNPFTGQGDLPLYQGVAAFCLSWLKRIVQRGTSFFQEVLSVLRHWLSHPLSLVYALSWSWVHMLFLFCAISLILSGMADPLPFFHIAGLWSLVYFVTLLPVSINGYGLQELALTLIFTHSGGIEPSNSLTLALIIRVLTMFASLPGAVFVPGILAGVQPVTSGEANG